jgi:hypothetical protein
MKVSYIAKWLSIPLVIGLLLLPVVVVSSPLARPSQEPVSVPANTSNLLFVENAGQFAAGARFMVSGANGGALWLADDGLWFTLVKREDVMREDGKRVNVKITFPGANAHPRLEPFDRRATVFNYFHGDDPAHWYADVPVWGGVRYVDIYPGVDLEITEANGHWTWQLAIRNSQFAISNARLRVEGAADVTVAAGYLRLTTAAGDLALPLLTIKNAMPDSQPQVLPVEEQTFDVLIPFSSFSPLPSLLSASDNPDALLLSTFLGGDNNEKGGALAVDDDGAMYVTGWTATPTFPTTPGAHDTTLTGNEDVFVTKLNSAGSNLVYSTFLGGTSVITDRTDEQAYDITVDGDGAVYITGETRTDDFPTTPGAYDTTYDPGYEVPGDPPEANPFVTTLGSSGALAYSTYLGPTSRGKVPNHGRGL